jgi:hypothetical protein
LYRKGQSDGWEKAFKKTPAVSWVDGKHSYSFNDENIDKTAEKIFTFLKQASLTENGG